MGSSPGIEAITRSAMARASSPSPAWACSAPQHPSGDTANEAPAASINAAVARCVSRIQASITQPVYSQTCSVRRGRLGSTRLPRRSGSRASPARRGTSRSRCAPASSVDPARSSRCLPSTASPARSQRGAVRCASANASRVPSIRCPNGTPLGHAGSQPRHCTHVSMNRTNSPSAAPPRHWTLRIASMRPRGDRPSSPVARNVGQCGRHNPHATHDDSSCSSRCRSNAISRHPTVAYPTRPTPSLGAIRCDPPSGRESSPGVDRPGSRNDPRPDRSRRPDSRHHCARHTGASGSPRQ